MIRIHHIEGRRSERIPWLLEELGDIPYELEFVPGDVPASLLRIEPIHETRMTPIVEIDGAVMMESGAIIEYILATRAPDSPLKPQPGDPHFGRFLEFFHYSEATAMAKCVVALALSRHGIKDEPMGGQGLAASRSRSQRVMYFCDRILGERNYFAGDMFTAADIMMHFPLKIGAPLAVGQSYTVAQLYDYDHDYYSEFPNVHRFMVDMAERPAFQRAIAATLPSGPPPM